MAIFIPNSSTNQLLLNLGDEAYIRPNVAIVTDSEDAIYGPGPGVQLTIDGTVVSVNEEAVFLNSSATDPSFVLVGEDAIVRGGFTAQSDYGIYIAGDASTVINGGEVSGAHGVFLYEGADVVAFNAGTITGVLATGVTFVRASGILTNTGTISGPVGVRLDGSSDVVVRNAGAIVASGGEDAIFGEDISRLTLRNSGAVMGDVRTGDLADVVINHGSIAGDVLLGLGADTYRGKGSVDGVVDGGGGSDMLMGGNADDRFAGGKRTDTLLGGAGDDVLDGGQQNDRLNGGRGDDVLTGGSGSDVFAFRKQAGDDVVTDFRNNLDLIDLSAYGLRPVNFADVLAATSSTGGPAVVLDLDALGGDGSVLIEGLALNRVDASDFIL